MSNEMLGAIAIAVVGCIIFYAIEKYCEHKDREV